MSNNRIKNFQISFFAIILGLSGLSIAFQKGEIHLGIPGHLSYYFIAITITVFTVLLLLYSLKFIKYRDEVKKDFHHPVKANFFPAISISLVLFSIAFLKIDMGIAKILWIIGLFLHLIFTLVIMSNWLNKEFKINSINPAWFIPAVGNILAPVSGVPLGFIEISWFFFSIGIIFWLMLFTIFFNRIIFHNPLPDKLKPTMFIFIAPPAIGFIAYVNLIGNIDAFAKILYYLALFLVILLVSQIKMFAKINFYISWWAYTFPIAAMSLASILMYTKSKCDCILTYKYIALLLITILSILIIIISIKTIISIIKKEICVEEDD